MAYPMYNNQYYMQDLQNMKDKIESQMRQLQQQNQMQQPQMPTNLTQNFQLAPQTNNELESKYVNNIDEVKGIFVLKTGIFINKELNTLWLKNTNGEIRTFELNEIVEMDERDKEIQMLKQELERMKGMVENANKSNVDSSDFDGEFENKSTTKLSNSKRTNAK